MRSDHMAPKPASASKTPPGKKPTGAGSGKKQADSKMVPSAGAPAGEDGVQFAPPKNKEEVLAQVSFEGLPPCPTEQIIELIDKNYTKLVKIFAHYCKFSECKTVEMATRCRLGALLTHAGLVAQHGLTRGVKARRSEGRCHCLPARGASAWWPPGTLQRLYQLTALCW